MCPDRQSASSNAAGRPRGAPTLPTVSRWSAGAANPRAVYGRLLAELPVQRKVRSCLVGLGWTVVESEACGIAMTFREGLHTSTLRPPLAGRSLTEVAGHMLGWNLYDAAIGLAALNSYFNAPARVQSWLRPSLEEAAAESIFEVLAERIAGQKVAVVGHFPDLELLAADCRLTILERRPQRGDLPDPACEYVLPEQDVVFITGTAFTNRTLPRLLELARDAFLVLVGPSVPLTPLWFEFGVDLLAGTVVTNPAGVRRAAEEGAHREIFAAGAQMVKMTPGDVRLGFRP